MPNVSPILLPASAFALAVLPLGRLALGLALLVAADLAVALLIARVIAARRKKTDGSVVAFGGDIPMHLLRRTEPSLRSRRPIGVVEMQVRWRQAAEAHRRNRERAS